jgi:hypothetical protein
MTSKAEYRQKAEECRQRAAQSILPHDKAEWLRLAREWQKLADSAAATTVSERPERAKPQNEG